MNTLALATLADLDLLHAQRALTEAMGALTSLQIASRRIAPAADGSYQSSEQYRAYRDAQTLLAAWAQITTKLAR